MFEKEVYIARRKALLERLKGEKGIALFLGHIESPAQYGDNCYKWRQSSTWLYYFGIDEPRLAATIDLETGEETLFGDDFGIDDIIWMGPMPTGRELADRVGIANTAPYDAVEAVIKGRKVHFLPTSRYYNRLKLASLLGIDPTETASAGKAGCAKASAPLVKAVIGMRLIKEPREIARIDAACDLGYKMHSVARRGIRPGRIEQEIVGEMESVALSKGWGVSFATILTQHGEIFHCHSHESPVVPGKLMVVDAGVESNDHYASDFTRTYPTSGLFTSRQRAIYQTVYECNELAFRMTRPGISYRDVHLAVAAHMLDNLQQLDIVHGDIDEMVADGIAGLFMPHGLGHNMGLDVHDMEDLGENLVGYSDDQVRSAQLGLGSLRMARKLQPGHVITDEPGIYFIPALIDQWKREGTDGGRVNYALLEKEYLDFGGIRLEDDVLVTEDGARRLGSLRLPIAPDEVETIMQIEQL